MIETDEEALQVLREAIQRERIKRYTHFYLNDENERLIYSAALHLAIRMWVSGQNPPDTVTHDEMGYINYFVSRVRLGQMGMPGEQW